MLLNFKDLYLELSKDKDWVELRLTTAWGEHHEFPLEQVRYNRYEFISTEDYTYTLLFKILWIRNEDVIYLKGNINQVSREKFLY